jgi:hypothetical protein
LIQLREEFDAKFPETSQVFKEIITKLEELSEETISTTGESPS